MLHIDVHPPAPSLGISVIMGIVCDLSFWRAPSYGIAGIMLIFTKSDIAPYHYGVSVVGPKKKTAIPGPTKLANDVG